MMMMHFIRHCPMCLKITSCSRTYASQALPKITVPHQMIQKIQKEQVKKATKERQLKHHYKGPLIISCKRAQYNHYSGQTYRNFSPDDLASHGWQHYKSKGDHFTINAYRSNPALDVEGVESFTDLGLNEQIITALSNQGLTAPTNVQTLAIPEIQKGANLMCAAETGSGKTLAYILPIIQNVIRHNTISGPVASSNQPIGIIVVPSRELALQVHDVTERLGAPLGCQSHVVIGGSGTKKILRSRPEVPVDILISTPGVLSKLLSNRLFDMGRLSHIVLDEADTLFDDSFATLTLRLVRKMNIACDRLDHEGGGINVGTQLSLFSATLPRNLDNLLQDIVPHGKIQRITTKHLHRLMPHVPQKFVRLGPDQRPEAIKKAVANNMRSNIHTIIFCNNSSTACYLGYIFDDEKIDNIILHANMPQKVRDSCFDRFQSGECKLLISTDVGSRGLDTNRVQHVINYEFPKFMSDYIHRVGRVGRVNSPSGCFVLNFISYKRDIDLVWSIEAAGRRVTELHNVNANIKRKLVGMAEQKKLLGEAEQIGIN